MWCGEGARDGIPGTRGSDAPDVATGSARRRAGRARGRRAGRALVWSLRSWFRALDVVAGRMKHHPFSVIKKVAAMYVVTCERGSLCALSGVWSVVYMPHAVR